MRWILIGTILGMSIYGASQMAYRVGYKVGQLETRIRYLEQRNHPGNELIIRPDGLVHH